MQRDDEKLLRLKQQRSKEAIDLAMQGKWQEAVAVNKEILESFPGDVDSCNRLGRAYMELGDYAHSREAYSRAVELDPFNAIARKNLQRLSYLKDASISEVDPDKVEPHHFIEEIGKAGVVRLYDLASEEILAKMVAGDRVNLKADGASLKVENGRGEYLGQLEVRHAQRLTRLMAGGNRYVATVINSNEDMMTIIIREIYQDPSQLSRLSFPPKGLEEVRPYAGERAFKLESEYEEEAGEESGYTIIGGDEIEVLPEETDGTDDDADSDEE